MADRILRVCLARDLPPREERLPNYIYFVYDNLALYLGSQDAYTENYVLVETMPEEPVTRMFYIVISDGTFCQYIDYSVQVLAEIEDPSQIELLRKAGTAFFVNGDSKYIDKQIRTLVLPFNNGVYELAVNADKEQKFTNDTIIKYNEEHGRFEIYGSKTNSSGGDNDTDEYVDYNNELVGRDTASVSTKINGSRINAYVILSKAFDNALKQVSDGLYVRSDNKVNKDDFDQFKRDVVDFKNYAYAILDNLDAEIKYVESIISEDAIRAEIMSQLEGEIPNINEMIDAYDEVKDQLDDIESNTMHYASSILNTAIEEIDEKLSDATQWEALSEDPGSYEHEINYYEREKEYEQEFNDEEMEEVMAVLGPIMTGTIVL